MQENLSSTTCHSCGAPLTPVPDKSYFLCSFCGAYYFPEASQDGVKIIGEPASFTCPVCKMPLVTAMIEDVHVQACTNCRGVMITQDQLVYIVRTLRLTSQKMETVLPVNRADMNQMRYCQTCGKKLDTHLYGGGGNVVIDLCQACKTVWFDYGELKRVIIAPDFRVDQWR